MYSVSQNQTNRVESAQSMRKSVVDTICDTPGDSIMDRFIKISQNDFEEGNDLVAQIDGQIKKMLGEIVLSDFE